MKERPILMSAPMVQAVLGDLKTQTRRIVKGAETLKWEAGQCFIRDEGAHWNIGGQAFKCPYGALGDRLWIREAWRVTKYHDGRSGAQIGNWNQGNKRNSVFYEADGEPPKWTGRYRHGRFMPRWASRLTLEITSIRVERLNDISEKDAIAEGIEVDGTDHDHCRIFRELWESIHGENSWDENPWVWVIEFKRLESYAEAMAEHTLTMAS